jgi:hypothetical protein
MSLMRLQKRRDPVDSDARNFSTDRVHWLVSEDWKMSCLIASSVCQVARDRRLAWLFDSRVG